MSGVLGFGLYNHTTPALRIAYDPATDLATEDPANVGKFMFDSLLGSSVSYFYEIFPIGYDSRYQQSGSYSGGNWFFFNHDFDSPYVASNVYTTCGAIIHWNNSGAGAQVVYFFDTWWNFGFMPYLEYRPIDPALPANTYKGAIVDYDQYQVSQSGYVISTAGLTSQTTGNDLTLTGLSFSTRRRAYNISTKSTTETFDWLVSVWQIPAMEDALPDFSAAPISGQEVLLINPTTARLALPGRTVSDPNIDHYIFHEDKIPAKVMRAGDINIAGNATVNINCPLPLTDNTYMDFMVKRQTDAEFWNPPYFDSIASDNSLAFTYFVDTANDRVVVTNGTATAITLRYLILADSDDAPTTGGKKVLYKGNDGTQDFVQIKRPGSSDVAPNLNDIMVDSRLAYIPILAQGYLLWTADFPTVISAPNLFKGERMATVNVSNPSPKMKLFVKQNVLFLKQCEPLASQANLHKVFTDAGSWTGRVSQNSSWANIHADESAVDFYMGGANPLSYDSGGASYNREPTSGGGVDTTALGLSYVIFGIPQSL